MSISLHLHRIQIHKQTGSASMQPAHKALAYPPAIQPSKTAISESRLQPRSVRCKARGRHPLLRAAATRHATHSTRHDTLTKLRVFCLAIISHLGTNIPNAPQGTKRTGTASMQPAQKAFAPPPPAAQEGALRGPRPPPAAARCCLRRWSPSLLLTLSSCSEKRAVAPTCISTAHTAK
jgi:hypothetical protein